MIFKEFITAECCNRFGSSVMNKCRNLALYWREGSLVQQLQARVKQRRDHDTPTWRKALFVFEMAPHYEEEEEEEEVTVVLQMSAR
jgi:hypothetical protein